MIIKDSLIKTFSRLTFNGLKDNKNPYDPLLSNSMGSFIQGGLSQVCWGPHLARKHYLSLSASLDN